jgi:hypothetical protein
MGKPNKTGRPSATFARLPVSLLFMFLFFALLPAAWAGQAGSSAPLLVDHQADATPLPARELGMREIYKRPVGPQGLEPTEKLLSLNHERVRLQGYLVQEEEPLAGLFLLTPVPVALSELADGPADDLPATTLFVHLDGDYARRFLPYRPGLWSVVGRLELGGLDEANGRRSYVRLLIEGPAAIRDPSGRTPELALAAPAHDQHAH